MIRLILILFFITTNVLASVSAQTSESSSALATLKEKTKKYTLSNGLRVIMYRRGFAPVFSGVITVRVGGVDEQEGQTGISHMFEHMAFKGTSTIGTLDYSKEKKLLEQIEEIALRYPAGKELSKEDQDRWAELTTELNKIWRADDLVKSFRIKGGQELNATTAKELTNYMISLPSSAFEFWCWIESERLLNPVLRQFYQERDVVMEERRMRYDDSPPGKLYELLLSTAFTIHPYRNPVIGHPQDIMSLTATETEAFRKHYYVPSNIVVSIVGDVDPKEDIAILEKYFGRLPKGPEPKRISIVEPVQDGQREVRFNTRAAPQAFLAFKKPNYPHPDDAPIGVMAEMLAGTRSSPLFTELVRKRKVVTSIDYDETPGTAYPNLLLFSGVVRAPHSNDDFIRSFDEVVTMFKKSKVDEELLEIAKRSLAMSYLGHLKSNLSLARDFGSSELLHGGWESSIDWYDQAMAVTADDVKRVANTYLTGKTRTIARIESERTP